LLRTLGSVLLALQVPGDAGVAPAPPAAPGAHTGIVDLIADASPVAWVVLAVLLLFSIASWAVIFYKLWAYQRIERQSAAFIDVFRRSTKFSEVQSVCKSLGDSPLVGMFQAGYAELNAQLKGPAGASPPAAGARPTLRSLASLDRALLRASSVELNKLEHRVTFLATTASITPFIGLLGTVWGIMTSFQGIAAQGSSDLAVVAPGIAEALIATALGLFAAIPAVYFYNHFTTKVKLYASEMDDFAMEFLNISERNFT
jgi:biopolymer transport protein TolQ